MIRGKEPPGRSPGGKPQGYIVRIDRLLAEAATRPPQEDTSSEDGDVEAGAYNEGSGKDEAAVSATRRSYTASGEADNPKAAAFTVGRARTARAVVSPTKAHGEGADEDLAVLAASGTSLPR